MAVYTSICYKQPVNADLFNEHVAEVISPGIYRGMYIRPHGMGSFALDVRHILCGEDDKNTFRTDLNGLVFTPQGVRIKVTSPQFYDPEDDVLSRLIIQSPSSSDRIDLVYMEYEYKNVPASENKPHYGIIQGTPASEGEAPAKPEIYLDSEVSDRSDQRVIDINYLKSIRIPMAYVTVKHDAIEIKDEDIENVDRVKNTASMMEFVETTIRNLVGNLRIGGWGISQDSETKEGWILSPTIGTDHPYASSVTITPGKGVINGIYCESDSPVVIDDLEIPADLTGVKAADSEVSLTTQPRYPSRLIMTMVNGTDVTIPSGSYFTISAKWIDGAVVTMETRTFYTSRDIPPSDSYLFVSDPVVNVLPSGLGFGNILNAVSGGSGSVTFSIDGGHRDYIVASANENQAPSFRVLYDPGYITAIPDTDMILGYIDYKLGNDGRSIVVATVASKKIYGAGTD